MKITLGLLQLLLIPLIASLFSTCSSTYNDQTVEIIDLDVPKFPKSGEDVVLTCRFRLGGTKHQLYTVTWWKGKENFYSYKKYTSQPKHANNIAGISVKLEDSTEESVVLQNVNEATTGDYKCEVMGEGPAFRTAVKMVRMRVIVPPERMQITHGLNRDSFHHYQPDDLIRLNCTAHRVKPRPNLYWMINGQEVKRTEVQMYPDFEDHRGRVTSTLGLRFLAPKYFVNRISKVKCVAMVEDHRFEAEEEIRLDPSAAFDLYSSGVRTQGNQISTAFEIFFIRALIGSGFGYPFL